MKIRLDRLLCVSLLLCMGLAIPRLAAAQAITSPYRFVETRQAVTVFAGNVWAEPGELEFGAESAPYFGASYGLRVTGPLVLEAELAYMPSTRAIRDTLPDSDALSTVGEADVQLVLATAGLRFNITGPRTYRGFQPFLRAAAGVVLDLAGESAAEQELPADLRFDLGTTFAWQIGGGIEWFLARRLGLRVGGNVMLWEYDTPLPFLLGDEGLNRPGEEWTQHYSVTAGLVLRF